LKHEARPSCLFDMNRGFTEYLKQAHAEDESIPVTLQDLQNAGIRLLITDGTDPDSVGFEQWSVYAA
jgi:hypothetical protein